MGHVEGIEGNEQSTQQRGPVPEQPSRQQVEPSDAARRQQRIGHTNGHHRIQNVILDEGVEKLAGRPGQASDHPLSTQAQSRKPTDRYARVKMPVCFLEIAAQ